MSKVRVYEVAKQLNMDQKALVSLFQSMGIGDVKNYMSTVEPDAIDRVKRHLERQKTPEVVEERIRPTVVKRKARGADGDQPGGGRSDGPEPSRSATPVPPARSSSHTAAPVPPARSSSPTAAPVPPARSSSPAAVSVPPARSSSPVAVPAPAGSAQGVAVKPVVATPPAAIVEAPKAQVVPTHQPSVSEPAREEIREAVSAPQAAPVVTSAPSNVVERSALPAVVDAHVALPPARETDAVVVAPKPQESAPVAAAAEARASAAAAPTSAGEQPAQKPASSSAPVIATPVVVDALPAVQAAPVAAKVAAPKPVVAHAAPAGAAPKPAPRSGQSPSSPAKPGEQRVQGKPSGDHPKRTDVHTRPASHDGSKSGAAGGARTSQQQGGRPLPGAPNKPGGGPQGGQPGRPQQGGANMSTRPSSQHVSPSSATALRKPSDTPSTIPPRSSSPPKTGIDVWQGRPGVPMPAAQQRTSTARRTTYDPRAQAPQARPGTPGFGQAARPAQGGAPRGPGGNQRGGSSGQGGFRGRPAPMMQRRGPAQVSTQEMASHKKVVKIEEQVSLQQLAGKMSVKATDVLMKLLSMGMTGVNINSTLDADTAKILASEFGWSVEDVAVSETSALEDAMRVEAQTDMDFVTRPPIVTVMGHVDHGKTSLLDRIRKATVADGEAGGITQHVGAYRVETPRGIIAFLDTPGHEAFTAMRARGASLTDIVVLVVAADDGVMPQTREAISHAQAAKVPIIVAVNKIDKPGADPEKIKRDLANFGLQPEEWGGQTMFIHVSAKTGANIDQLLEAIILQAEILELKAYPKRRASGTVIEALLDRGRGPVARVMIQDGNLRTGDYIIAGGAWGKVRAMTDELGRSVGVAGPATPVEVLGLAEVPSAGDPVHAVKDAKTAEEIAETRRKKAFKSLIPQDSRMSLEALTTRLAESEQLELKLIVKGDVQGSVEAICHSLSKLTTPKVKVTIVHAGVGGITEGDVNLAVASKAIIVGFNVRPAGKAASHAESENIEIRLYNIIYNAIDDIRSAMEGLLPATKVEKLLGRAAVRQVFRIAKSGTVAGCMVLSGMLRRAAEARLLRDNVVVWLGKLSGLRRFKDDAKEVTEGFECGISLDNFQDIKEGDIVESFDIEEIKTKLS